jgi:5'(3')-deoxyribonucleotidase
MADRHPTNEDAERLRLGIDLDGVVADFNVGWMERYNRQFDKQLHHTQVVSWDGLHGLTHFETMDEFWDWASSGPSTIFRELPAIPGAVETMAELALEHRIVIVSSKFDWAIPDTLEWLAEQRILAREIHFVWDKTRVPCDVYLEDSPANLEALVAAHPRSLVCRMVRPWNRPLDGALDVPDWPAFQAAVQAWAGRHEPAEDGGLPRR